jgi:hypothetical protein
MLVARAVMESGADSNTHKTMMSAGLISPQPLRFKDGPLSRQSLRFGTGVLREGSASRTAVGECFAVQRSKIKSKFEFSARTAGGRWA